ncbi:hypothetical protein N7509_001169 [Penicillium cosmopolitanum]|uniref:Uncharacterized protein n=1 Tax=Penicillium cosmopolitanum TaxID=1131564 RepID=A0A9X0BES9_9EURO|nr:uncharacterized protein N7509_001169 [Penicillium cosmopolitanum]KAJ5414542.1 hypothetical protein N7509_001169 [Penicillium cosmopolitanum]
MRQDDSTPAGASAGTGTYPHTKTLPKMYQNVCIITPPSGPAKKMRLQLCTFSPFGFCLHNGAGISLYVCFDHFLNFA